MCICGRLPAECVYSRRSIETTVARRSSDENPIGRVWSLDRQVYAVHRDKTCQIRDIEIGSLGLSPLSFADMVQFTADDWASR